MAFHLEGPWLSTTGKKRGPKKWASAEAKRKAQQLQAEWEVCLGTIKKMAPKFSGNTRPEPKPTGVLTTSPRIPPGRETPQIASLDTGWVACTKKSDTAYTGEKVLGISVLHKSNGVPVFSQEEVIDISKMRR
jgi:hypothetical protein